MKNKILFVGHDASYTGAPIVFLHLLKWIKEHCAEIEITILLKGDGPLKKEYEACGETYLWNAHQTSPHFAIRMISKILNFTIGRKINIPFPKKINTQHFDLIYLNTVDTLDLAVFLKDKFTCPIISHIHELDYSINYYFSDRLTKSTINAVDQFIAVSKSTKENLITSFAIPEKKIKLVYEFIPINSISKPTISCNQIKNELNIKDEFIIGGAGLTSWRKGVDIFFYLATTINKKLPENNIKFLWIGRILTEFKHQLDYEIKRCNIVDKIIFTDNKQDPHNYFQLFDIFALTSREDPFPLVCLEAAALGKPIFCFEQSGGIPELVDNGAGKAYEYGDLDGFAEGIIKAYKNQHQLKIMGEQAQIIAQEYDVNLVAPKIHMLIKSMIKDA